MLHWVTRIKHFCLLVYFFFARWRGCFHTFSTDCLSQSTPPSSDPEEGLGSPCPFTPVLNHPGCDRPLMKDRRERRREREETDREMEREMQCAGGSPQAAGETNRLKDFYSLLKPLSTLLFLLSAPPPFPSHSMSLWPMPLLFVLLFLFPVCLL